jgi:hypothetical protein
MVDDHALGIAEEHGVTGRADQLVQLVELRVHARNHPLEGAAPLREFARRQNAWHLQGRRIDAEVACRALPRDRHLVHPRGGRAATLCDQINVLGVTSRRIDGNRR